MSNRGSACPPGWRLPESQHAILRSPRIRVGCPDLLFSEEREMPHGIRCLVWCWAVVACAVFAGCSDPDRAPTAGDGAGGTGTTGTSKGTGSAASADGKGVDSGSKPNGDKAGSAEESGADLSAAEEKFVVPSREDVEARANWFDQPVANLLDRRKEQEKGTPPEASAALALRNNTRQTNEQIVATLGRVAQSDDDVDYNATLNKHIKADARSTNPLLQSSVYEVDVQGLIGLLPFTFDRDLNRVGDADVIVSWQTSSDRMMDKVVLRDDLVWSDGVDTTVRIGGAESTLGLGGAVSVGDADGDGVTDILVQVEGVLASWRGLGGGVGVPMLGYMSRASRGRGFVGDLSGDGVPDGFWLGDEGAIWYAAGLAAGAP